MRIDNERAIINSDSRVALSLHQPLPTQTKLNIGISWLFSVAVFIGKIPSAITICILNGSLAPLKTLFNKHIPFAFPLKAKIEIARPIQPPTKFQEPTQRSLLFYLLGAAALTLVVGTILYAVKSYLPSDEAPADIDPPPLPSQPLRTPALMQNTSSSSPKGLSFAVASTGVLVGLIVYAARNYQGSRMVWTPTSASQVKHLQSVQEALLGNTSQTEDLINLMQQRACVGEEDAYCQYVIKAAIQLYSKTSQTRTQMLIEECEGKLDEACQYVIKTAPTALFDSMFDGKTYNLTPFHLLRLGKACRQQPTPACLTALEQITTLLMSTHLLDNDPYSLMQSMDYVSTCFDKTDDACQAVMKHSDRFMAALPAKFAEVCNNNANDCKLLLANAYDFVLPCLHNPDPTCQNIAKVVDEMLLSQGKEIYKFVPTLDRPDLNGIRFAFET